MSRSSMLPRLRKALRQAGDPVKAPIMQAYMKSAMPYHGVPTPLLRQVCKATFADVQFATALHWQAQVLDLWRNARFREERYAALYLAGDRRGQPYQTPSAVKTYEELIVTGAWWDYVDDIASHRIGPMSARIQDGNRSGVAVRLHRTLVWIGRILPAEGHRLGAAPVRVD